ncbi:MAG: DUF4298 domain-containing protein [Ruminococcaceae bacterium]|nr:DUF4298 domain-containing protein [Oscillospiraceae bacterium]
MTEQIKRIMAMEEDMDEVCRKLEDLSAALDGYEEILPRMIKLTDYYDNGTWMADYRDDEEGKLPADLKRGVLSEDGLYDVLAEHRRILDKMKELFENEENKRKKTET